MTLSNRPPLEERLASLRACFDNVDVSESLAKSAMRGILHDQTRLVSYGMERQFPGVASPREVTAGMVAAHELPHDVPMPPFPLEDPYTGIHIQE